MELAQAIQQARNNELTGFETIYNYSADNLYFKASILIEGSGNPLVLVHDTYVSAFKSIHLLKSPSDFRVWLGEIFYSKISKFANLNVLESQNKTFDNEDIASIIKYFEMLSLEQKSILIFSYYDGCSTGQVSQIMNIDEVEIKRIIKTSRQKVEDGIKEERGIDIKVNAAAFTYAFCQSAKDAKIPVYLTNGIFQNICVDSGVLPSDSINERINFETVNEHFTSAPTEANETIKSAEITELTLDIDKPKPIENDIPSEKQGIHEKKQENRFSKSILGKLFKGI